MTRSPLSVRTIAEVVAEVCGVAWAEIVGDYRDHRIVRARQLGMWQARRRTGRSTPTIGRVYGRDHATVLRAIRQIDLEPPPQMAATDAALDQIEAALRLAGVTDAEEPDPVTLARRILTGQRAASMVSVDELRVLAEHIVATDAEMSRRFPDPDETSSRGT